MEEHLAQNSADWSKHERHHVNYTVDKNDCRSRRQVVMKRKQKPSKAGEHSKNNCDDD